MVTSPYRIPHKQKTQAEAWVFCHSVLYQTRQEFVGIIGWPTFGNADLVWTACAPAAVAG